MKATPGRVHKIMPDKIVLITGATRGIGRAMAKAFAGLGHTVVGCGRSEKEIDQLRNQLGPPHDFQAVDVAADQQVQCWAKQLLGSHGPPDLLLNNAGVINKNAALWEISAEEFSLVIDVNLKGSAKDRKSTRLNSSH